MNSPQTITITGTGTAATTTETTATQFYAGIDSHMHELYIYDGAWHDSDLTAAAGGPNVATGTSIAEVIDPIENVLRINYGGADQHMHELYNASGTWYDCDLTVAAGGPNIAPGASIASLFDTIANTLRVNYAGADQHMHELYIAGGAWHDCDLTAATGGPNIATGAPTANLIDTIANTLRINYGGADQHVHELYIAGGAWHDCDLTAAAGGPNMAAGASIANLIDTIANTLRINYAGADQHLHELYIAGGAWHDCDLTAAAGGPNIAAGASTANLIDTIANTLRINYGGADQHVHELYIAGGAWHDCDLTAASAGPKIAARGLLDNFVDASANVLRVNYIGIDSQVHELFIAGGAWHDCDLTAAAGGPLTAMR
ncbi:MAG: hypothetical protein JO210_01570 [Acidobacteriaceae bacterium]|nr:hypothetical protein [Acidobacteriaceae bacterium]